MEKNKKILLFVFYDIIIVCLSLYVALMLRFDFNIESKYITFYKITIIPLILLTLFFNMIFKLYNKIWKYASIDELLSIIYSISITNIVFVIGCYVLIHLNIFRSEYYRFPYTVHIIFWMLTIILSGGIRFAYRVAYENIEKRETEGKKKIKLLIIGAGDAAVVLLKEIRNNKKLNYDIVGLIDDAPEKLGKFINGIKIIGNRNDIKEVVEKENVQEIIIAIPSASYEDKKQIFNICKNTNCTLKTMPGINEVIDKDFNVAKLRNVNIEDLLGREEVKLNDENINKYIKGKNIMVTGGGGSIGSELCRQIAKFKPKKLIILDIYENNAYDLQMELNYNHPELDKEVIIASIRDKKRLDAIFKEYKPDVVFHAAAHKHVPLMEDNPSESIKNNILGTYNVIRCCDENNVKKFVQISTDKAVNPTNIMGATKRFCELMVQAFGKTSKTELVAVRFGNVLGSNGSVIPLFKKQISHGGPVTVTHPEINRFFMTIPEAAQLVIQAGAMAHGGEIFVLDMGEPVKIVDLAKDLITLSGLTPDVDIKIEFTGLRPGEKLYEEPLMDEVALTTTEHDKIRVEKPKDIDVKMVENAIEEFRKVIYCDNEAIFSLVEKVIPTYNRKDGNEQN